ncbi:hypothetical protein E4V36_07080 [Proteus mirabilis]|uniref:Uncharacterized protein n=2 Tax=Morganella morganii TaxID=582 RepID=A0AAE4JR92_MORMO|nr:MULTISPECIES: hypothetical protein [Morganellaceae]MCD4607941.1 hypothetical protein [Proteus mirabilis]MDS0897974.1 hypothetical protein [Morganella morganii]TFT75026.1 hypothetical protein E4V36_07080 [Proteus mirabilis]TFT94759.1 hypothetical protein E4V35_13285 [Proteus mirabilis]HCT3120303.1 hypothetical protein [Morganella morganii]
MSLMDTFVQVFEFDTRQADSTFDRVQRSTDDIIDGMKQAQTAAQQGADSLGGVFTELWQSLQGLSGEHAVDFSTNAADVAEQTGAVKAQVDAVTDSLSELESQQAGSDAGWQNIQASLTGTEAGYQALVQAVAALSSDTAVLTDEESRGNAVRQLAGGIIKALQGDYRELGRIAEDVGKKSVAAGSNEVVTQKKVQNELNKTDTQYQKAGESVAGFAKKALTAVGLFMSASALVGESVARAAEIESLDKFGKKINVATADVDAFAGSVAELGGTREAAQSDMEAMAKSFGFAGNSMEKILRTADKVQGMKFDKAKATLGALGVSDDKTVELMMKGRKELERMMRVQKEYSGITRESIEQSVKFNKSMQSFKQSSGLLKNSFLEMVIPILATGLEWVSKFVGFCKENKTLITGFFIAVGIALATYYVPPMLAAAAATLAATLPIIAIIAVIALLAAAFALVYDDIMNFIDGNDSMIGRILDKYPALKTVILALWDAFKVLFDFIKTVVKVVADIVVDAYNIMNKALNDFIGWLTGSIKGVMAWGNDFGKVFSTVSDTVVGIFKWLWEQIKSYLDWIGKGLDKIKEGWATLKGWFGAGDDVEVDQTVNRTVNEQGQIGYDMPPEKTISEEDAAKMAQAMTAHLYGVSNDPMNPVTSQAISNQSTTSNETNISIGELKVETQATDAQGMAAGAKDALGSQLQDFGHQTNTGLGK